MPTAVPLKGLILGSNDHFGSVCLGAMVAADACSEIEGSTAQTASYSIFRLYWRLVPRRARCDDGRRMRAKKESGCDVARETERRAASASGAA